MLKTPLHEWHVARGARMVDFAGWEMPIQYTSITGEHHAVRRAAGLFDIAHMGRIRFTGPDACRCLDHLLTNNVAALKPGQVRYSLVCNEAGGILDDVLVYRCDSYYLLVVNASNREKIVGWIDRHKSGFDILVEDMTFDWSMVALQGPRALEILAPITETDLAGMKYYTAVETIVNGETSIVSRTGYTGEDGFEIMLPAAEEPPLCDRLMADGAGVGLVPCGLGCRDTLRLEAAMPLYGHEMDESMDPLTAGLGFGVKLDAADFIGKEALVKIKANPADRQRVGLKLAGRRIAREGSGIFSGATEVGRVTSGTFSPTLEASIAMGYVPKVLAAEGTALEVDIRGKREGAKVVALPFYRRG
jgi:aminomethyltransferase